jgi:DNA polymerase-3 subunit alpha
MSFVHLHVHTQYSILDGLSSIPELFRKAQEDGQKALAITDHGDMYGVYEFLDTAKKFPEVKPIVGCEVYMARGDNMKEHAGKEDQSSYHLILLAKNELGYHNLCKIVSLGFTDGFYYRPRIDRSVLEKYHEGIICSSACLASQVAREIVAGDLAAAEETVKWFRNLFGDDYYLEVQKHRTEIPGGDLTVYDRQLVVAEEEFKLAGKYGIKVIATNDVHFVNKEDGPTHDRLICLTTNSNVDDPTRMRYTQQEYLKTQDEMAKLFPDHPEILENTIEIADKVEVYKIDHDPFLPKFKMPDGYTDSNVYLHDLTYEGAHRKYGENLGKVVIDRIEFELNTVKSMGFPDYFLIVWDYIHAARAMGVSVGPGRGSAAGSVVAYCLDITQLDPIRYDLLFERFLNPERVNMPDIDVDFDDEGRYKIFQYVTEKYGADHVSHVITFGTMGAKGAIKDVARIEGLPLSESDRLSKLIPDRPEQDGYDKKKPLLKQCIEKIPELKAASESENPVLRDTIKYAAQLEGTIRQVGVHACAFIIGAQDLMNLVPISIAEDKETGEKMRVSQFEGSQIEHVGLLKMDFLGLITLSILKEALANIKKTHGTELDIDHIPIDDKKTFELFSKADTTAVFQFESDGMKKWLRELHPSRFEDLIAMNALYRPGPMDYIPDFVHRKQGIEKIEYTVPEMEDILKDTYGVTVYQEQVMLLSRKLAGFTPGQADSLRKAMGKKKLDVMAQMNNKFMEGGMANHIEKEKLEKIWADWLKFAQYAFNKSHSTCYAWVGYQTGYLKAHYPAEFMAANLTKNLGKISEITNLMNDCRTDGISVLGPDINESDTRFTVNHKGEIRFGLGGIKGVGSNAIDAIIAERDARGPFKDVFDFIERVPYSAVNSKNLESLVYAGAFDSFPEMNRAQFFLQSSKEETFIECLLHYGQKVQNDTISGASSLFGGTDELKPVRPAIPAPMDFNKLEMLKREKDLVGMYLSAHPLDNYRFEIKYLATCTLAQLNEVNAKCTADVKLQNKVFYVAGLVTEAKTQYTKATQKPMGKLTVEDYSGNYTFMLFGKDYETYLGYMKENEALLIECETQPRFFKKDDNGGPNAPQEFSVRLKGISLLANAADKMVKELTIMIPTSRLNAKLNASLVKELKKKEKGNSDVIIRVIDDNPATPPMACEFISNKFRIRPDAELITYFDSEQLRFTFRVSHSSKPGPNNAHN